MRFIILFVIIHWVLAFNRVSIKLNIHSKLSILKSETDGSNSDVTTDASEIIETAEEKYRREKLAEIAEKKAQEVFVKRNTGRYECQACGYIFDEAVGNSKRGIVPGTPFETLEKFRCPQCGVDKKYFVAETETLSGFKENLKYGLGTNALTEGQKSNLIYGGLALFFTLFMAGYLLE